MALDTAIELGMDYVWRLYSERKNCRRRPYSGRMHTRRVKMESYVGAYQGRKKRTGQTYGDNSAGRNVKYYVTVYNYSRMVVNKFIL